MMQKVRRLRLWNLGMMVCEQRRGNFLERKNWMELAVGQAQVSRIMDTNQYTQKYGLTLCQQEAHELMEKRTHTLMETKRVEFGDSILPAIIYEFCDSAYIHQSDYAETLSRLQEIFFYYKNETMDRVSDEELLHFMKEQFESICEGDLDYLAGTCLEIFSQAVRAGYRGHEQTVGKGIYEQFDKVPRWDRELYQKALRELFWG